MWAQDMLRIMRIAVAGTHGSGKSTLIADFLSEHPAFSSVLEPFEYLDETDASPDALGFLRQLRVSERLLAEYPRSADLIAERSPLDFVAYLLALDELGRSRLSPESIASAIALAERTLGEIDLLAVLPLERRPEFRVGEDEDVPLREEMDRQLLDIVEEYATDLNVIEITGSRDQRRRILADEYTRLRGA